MHPSKWYLTLVGGAMLFSAYPATHQSAGARDDLRVSSLAFLAGCWELSRGPIHIAEHWLAPRGGTMLGVSRTVRDDRTTEFEFLRIIEREGKLVYIASPSGQATAEFTADAVTDSAVEFTNPGHDFPQKIRYVRRGMDSLIAQVSATVEGAERAREFAYARGSCRL